MLNIKLLDKKTHEFLINAGWYEERKVNISDTIIHLESEGYKSFPYVEEILCSLYKLYIRPENEGKLHYGEILIDPLDIGMDEFWRMEDYEKKAGEELFPLGL